MTLTKPVDLATPGLYEHYCNGKTVKEGVLTLCRRDKGAMLPFIIYTLTNVRISRMSNHGDAEGSATETVDLVYSHIRWDIPALASKSKTRRP
ncbi:type VI secretion system tube protein Hcp, partial [Aeromonas veronii]|uniref:type VI secretion system tube protein Hcp n=1 Tax=Aeromonas veronii TaxID=654 RepID=UPI00406C3E46